MDFKKLNIFKFIIPLFILNVIFTGNAVSQATGSLFMFQDNFHSQILNPSYMRNDDAIVISIVGLAGTTVGNSGNFKISDLIVDDQSGNKTVNFENFYANGNSENSVVDWSSLPAVFIGIPLSKGRLTIYLKEDVESSLKFNLTTQEFSNFGNITSYNADNVNYSGIGYRELAVGYAGKINDKISIGIRGKILFGAAFMDTDNWNYGVNLNKYDDNLELTHKGIGRLVLPITTKLDDNKMVRSMESENTIGKYFSSFHNPGLGIDLGATINLSDKSWLSVSATDLGAIWFRHNTMTIEQNSSHIFAETEIQEYTEDNGYGEFFDPYNLIINSKDNLSHLYRPVVDTASFIQGIVPKTSIHYQYILSDILSMGVTNQIAFYKKNILNILSFSALQKIGDFSIFENINLYRANTITVGGGIQYEGRFGQLFASTDNLLAVVQPMRNESFSFSVGISLLLNKPEEKKNSDGKFSPHFPFYKNNN